MVAPANAATIKDALKGKWAPQLCASSLAIFDLTHGRLKCSILLRHHARPYLSAALASSAPSHFVALAM